jgi:hypothetical protein
MAWLAQIQLVSPTGALEGPFIEAGNPTHNASSFAAQSTYVLPNPAWNSSEAAAGLARFIYLWAAPPPPTAS